MFPYSGCLQVHGKKFRSLSESEVYRDLLWTCKKCRYFIITCMLHVYILYTLHNILNNDNAAKKWDVIAIERGGGAKIMTGSPYSYYSRDSGSRYLYNIRDQACKINLHE